MQSTSPNKAHSCINTLVNLINSLGKVVMLSSMIMSKESPLIIISTCIKLIKELPPLKFVP